MGIDTSLTGIPNFNSFEIVKTGKITTSTPGGTGQFQIASSMTHGLGYTPSVLAYLVEATDVINGNLTDQHQPLPLIWIMGVSGAIAGLTLAYLYVGTGDNEISLVVNTPDTVGTDLYNTAFSFTVVYYLLRERAN